MTNIKKKKALEVTKDALEQLNISLEILKKAHSAKEKGVLEDGVIKRFETLFEYCWKLLKISAEYEGAEAPGPRYAIQEGARFGWIKDVELWALALDTRNATVHDYFSAAPENYMEVIKKFAKEVDAFVKKLS